MAQVKVRMAVDPFKVIENAISKCKPSPSLEKVISVDYDEEADVLYVELSSEPAFDSKALDQNGLVVAGLNRRGDIIRLTIMNAGTFER